jgi:hypothetical protein
MIGTSLRRCTALLMATSGSCHVNVTMDMHLDKELYLHQREMITSLHGNAHRRSPSETQAQNETGLHHQGITNNDRTTCMYFSNADISNLMPRHVVLRMPITPDGVTARCPPHYPNH